MKIETKFEINNLVQHKFDVGSKQGHQLYEVMEIATATCYAGTQNFYSCRSIIIQNHKSYDKMEEKITQSIHHSIAKDGSITPAWQKFREDELIVAKQELIDIILSGAK